VLGESEAEAGFPMTEVWIPDATWRRFIDEVMREANPAHGKVPASRSPGLGGETA
jgi:hypothetical protein